jgi:zinc transport system substrate-binding protein
LILDGSGSPHSHSLKPSQAKLLANADVIFWIGPALETFLQKPIRTVGAAALTVELGNLEGLVKLNNRGFEDFQISKPSAEHNHGTADPHIWLNPDNARIIAQNITTALARADPANAETYNINASSLLLKLDELTEETSTVLATVKDRPFLTHHDGYQYFETRFGLTSKGSLLSNSDILPGARHIAQITKKLKVLGNICVFTEPQLSQKLISTIAQDTNIKIAQLDPLGINIKNGPDLYFKLIRTMANSFHDCLSTTKL